MDSIKIGVRQIAFALIFFVNFPSFAQEDLREDFLKQVLDEVKDSPIKISIKISEWAFLRIQKALELNEFGFLGIGKYQKCEITQEERNRLLEIIESREIEVLRDFEDRMKIATFEDTELIVNKWEGQIFTFSEPVFFRDNTMVFFFQYRYCGPKCAEGRWSVYKRSSKVWVECLILTSFVS